MPRYKVYVKIESDDQQGHVVIDAKDPKAASEYAEELWDEDPDRFEWEPQDLTKPDLIEVITAEEID